MIAKKQGKISKILREAADEYLSPTGCESLDCAKYSCDAVYNACYKYKVSPDAIYVNVIYFLEELGVLAHYGDYHRPQFADEFEAGPERQGARFLWLDFAALVAEDEGL